MTRLIGFDTFDLHLPDMTSDELLFARARYRRSRRAAIVRFVVLWSRNRLAVLAILTASVAVIIGVAYLLVGIPGPAWVGKAVGAMATIAFGVWLAGRAQSSDRTIHPWRREELEVRADIGAHARTLRRIRACLRTAKPAL